MRSISRTINLTLILVMAVTLIVSTPILALLMFIREDILIERKMQECLDGFESDVQTSMDNYLQSFGPLLKDMGGSYLDAHPDYLKKSVKVNTYVTELSLADTDGVIRYSSESANIGKKLHGNGWSGDMYYVNEPVHGTDLHLEAGLDSKKYNEFFVVIEEDIAETFNVGSDGYILLCDLTGSITAGNKNKNNGDVLSPEDLDTISSIEGERSMKEISVSGADLYVCSRDGHGRHILAAYPEDKVEEIISGTVTLILFSAVLMLIIIFFFLRYMLRLKVADEMRKINTSLKKITEGDLEERADVRSSSELSELSDGINVTVDKLVDLIAAADAKYDEELLMARNIQMNSLPHVFPPYSNRKDFGIYASMEPAKEVGGDFYDCFMVSDDTVCLVIADVSDKGIPAALFMMRAKTTIRGYAASGLGIDEMMGAVNNNLCESNEAGMFVTVWIAYVHLSTGVMEYVHAGHTCPVILRDGRASFIKQKRSFIVGGRKNVSYAKQEYSIMPGDILFLYTDGVTEAFNGDGEEFGNSRLIETIEILGRSPDDNDCRTVAKNVCDTVGEAVSRFTEGVNQSDDITMLCMKYTGGEGHD